MQLNEYQQKAVVYKAYPRSNNVFYPLLALQEEIGEVSGKVAKFLRRGGTLSEMRRWDGNALRLLMERRTEDDNALRLLMELRAELGDVLWNLAVLAYDLGLSMEDIGEQNLSKLADRADRGMIIGEGDDR